jgi:hypothetical protein
VILWGPRPLARNSISGIRRRDGNDAAPRRAGMPRIVGVGSAHRTGQERAGKTGTRYNFRYIRDTDSFQIARK